MKILIHVFKSERHLKYGPYVEINIKETRLGLRKIAEPFLFLDKGFAEYFQNVVPSFNHKSVKDEVRNVRHHMSC